nr:MAG TPA: Glycine rich protein family [Caudoviricetes sp.]
MIIKIFVAIGLLSVLLILTFIFSALLAHLDDSDKLDEDREQEEYLEKWRKKRDGRT